MSKFVCNCGFVIDLVISPADEEYMLIQEINIEKVSVLCSKEKIDEDAFYDIIEKKCKYVVLCPNCERIWISEDKGVYQSFRKENIDDLDKEQ